MVRLQNRLFAAMVVMIVASASALAQQGGTAQQVKPQPQGAPNSKPLVVAPGTMTKPAPTAPVQRDPFDVARTTDANLTCMGPLRLEVTQVDPYDGSKGVGMKLIFIEAASAAGLKTGQCSRQGGFRLAGVTAEGVSLNADKGKGEIFYNPSIRKCPLMKSFVIEGGKLVDARMNDQTVAPLMLDYAQRAGQFTFATKWVDHKGGVPAGSLQSGYGRYTMTVGDAMTAAVPGCS